MAMDRQEGDDIEESRVLVYSRDFLQNTASAVELGDLAHYFFIVSRHINL